MTKQLNFDSFYQHLLERSAALPSKDGSLGLDVLSSVHQYQRAYRIVQQRLPVGADVLDWGGGSGHFSLFLHRQGFKTTIYAFDTPGFVAPEVQNGTVKFTQASSADPIRLPYPDNSFDAVCSIGVLEHVREIGGSERESLQEIQRILKPGGQFICYHLPNAHSWIEWLARRFGSYHHQYTFTKSQISNLFDGLLSIQLCERYAVLPRNSLRRLPRWLTNNRAFAYLFDSIDALLSKFIPRIHQNWLIIAKKSFL